MIKFKLLSTSKLMVNTQNCDICVYYYYYYFIKTAKLIQCLLKLNLHTKYEKTE